MFSFGVIASSSEGSLPSDVGDHTIVTNVQMASTCINMYRSILIVLVLFPVAAATTNYTKILIRKKLQHSESLIQLMAPCKEKILATTTSIAKQG